MKDVLISIRPQWVEKIASGEKTIEVRKTRPKLEKPFRCYIYCEKGTFDITHCRDLATKSVRVADKGRGKVIGEFICNRIEKYPYKPYTDGEHLIPYEDFEKIGMDGWEVYDYLRVNDGYGWHISYLKIYDKPKALSEFGIKCESANEIHCRDCLNKNDSDFCEKMIKPLIRPPQSWCYVEVDE